MTMKRYILLMAFFAALLPASAQSDATFSNITETYTLNSDGSVDYNYSKVLEYNTQYSFNRLFGETFVVYNPEFQRLKINKCYTVQKDGTRIDAPQNAFNEVLPSVAADAPDYNGLREMVITHTGLETGATVFLDYTIETGSGFYPSLDIDRIVSVQGADIKEYKIVIDVPQGTDLNWSLTGSNVKPKIDGGTYTWIFRNLPVGSGEYYTPRNSDGLPHLSVTTSGSLQQALQPLSIETRDICRAPQGVLEGAASDDDKIKSIHEFVVEQIGNCGVVPELCGYAVRQCRRVLETAYGTEAEKAFAMAKMLRGEGIDADVLFVFPGNVGAKSIKNISKYLVRCGGRFYSVLSSVPYNAALRADRDEIYDLAGNRVAVEPVVVDMDCKASFELSDGDVKIVSKDMSMTGIENDMELKSVRNVRKAGDYTVFTLPAANYGVDAWRMSILNTSRRESFEIPYAVDETYEYEISLDGVSSLTENVAVDISNPAGSLRIVIENCGDKVSVFRHIALNKTVFTAKEYDSVRKLLLAWNNPAYRKVVVK